MQIRQTNQEFNFYKYPTFGNDIDPKQRAWIEVRGKAIEKKCKGVKIKIK